MPQRDYIARSNEKKNKKTKKDNSVKTILTLIIVLVLGSGIGLWFMKENAPKPVLPQPVQINTQTPKSELPSRPEETWSYIRDLETRTVITDNSQTSQERLAQLTAQQKQQIEERRKQEEARLAAQGQENTEKMAAVDTDKPQLTEVELAAQKEEKRKEELKKQEEKKAEQAQAKLAAEKTKKEQQTKVVATPATAAEKEKVAAPATAGKFGLQCGAYKNKAQAENMQARLAMAGFNARIVSTDWNRVLVGPIGDRAAASRAQSNARSVAECVIVAM